MKRILSNFIRASGFTIAVVALALSVPSTDGQAAYVMGPLGGSGGGPFQSSCAPNDVLVGVRIRSGEALDAITAMCVALNAQRTDWAGQPYQATGFVGGPGGGLREMLCRPGDAVHVLTVATGPWGDITVVKGISLACHDLDSPAFQVIDQPALSTVEQTVSFMCNAGDWGTGVFGGSGLLVDRAGIVCDRISVAAAPPPVVAAPPVIVPPPVGAPPGGQPSAAPVVTVALSVELWTAPDGVGRLIGELPQGTQGVTLVEPCRNDWCHVNWPAGTGWVYSGPGYYSLTF